MSNYYFTAMAYTSMMHTDTITTQCLQLSIAERIQLLEDVWDSVASELPSNLSLTHEQTNQLHTRAAAHRADPASAISWERVREQVFARTQ